MFTPYKPTRRTTNPDYIRDVEDELDFDNGYTFHELCNICGYPYGSHSGTRCLILCKTYLLPEFYNKELNINIRLL